MNSTRETLAELDVQNNSYPIRGTKRGNHVLREHDDSNDDFTLKTKKRDSRNKSKRFRRYRSKSACSKNARRDLALMTPPSSTISVSGSQNGRSSSVSPPSEAVTGITTTIPLPPMNFADAAHVWKLMLQNDNLYKRDPNLFSHHLTLQPVMRATLLDWLNEVCQAYNLTRQTYYLALDFFDRYLSVTVDVAKRRLQLLGITCLFIAAKIEEIFPPKLKRFEFVCDGACDDSEILAKELVILNKLDWELHPITPIAWLSTYVKIYMHSEKADQENRHETGHRQANKTIVNESFLIPDFESRMFVQMAHLIDLCTLDAGSLAFSYSVIAAAAFFHFTNDNVVLQCTGKTMPEMQSCIEWMIPFAMAIKNAGFDFLDECENNQATIQTHTISLELLQSAHAIQADLEAEKLTMLDAGTSDHSSSLCPLTPSKLPLTPPRSSGFL